MKTLVPILLVAFAAAYYFGYEPSDFIPSFQPTPPPKVRHGAGPPAEQTQNAAPAPARSGSIVVANGPDGSLENRWTPYPSSSPTKH